MPDSLKLDGRSAELCEIAGVDKVTNTAAKKKIAFIVLIPLPAQSDKLHDYYPAPISGQFGRSTSTSVSRRFAELAID
jgi:hypothetical protein